VIGLDDTTMQVVHAVRQYEDKDIAWGARPADIVTFSPGVVTLDIARFHDTIPTLPTAEFPYPRRR